MNELFAKIPKKTVAINILKHFVETNVKPVANKLENDPILLGNLLKKMGELTLLGAKGPTQYGGLDLDPKVYHEFKEILARHSGILAFLQTQHQTAVQIIAATSNQKIKEKFLSDMCSGQALMGMGLSHLAKYDNPTIKGKFLEGDYLINGKIHFNTGYKYFKHLIIGFVAEDEKKEKKEIWAIVPFETIEKQEGARLIYSEPMQLSITQAANTVSLEIKDWLITSDNIIAINPWKQFYENSFTKTNMDSYHVGTALAALDVIANSSGMQMEEVKNYYDVLMVEIEEYRKTILKKEKNTLVAPIRAWGIELSHKCIVFARQVVGGQAILSQHPLNRIEREAALFSVITGDVNLLKALLERTHKTQSSQKNEEVLTLGL